MRYRIHTPQTGRDLTGSAECVNETGRIRTTDRALPLPDQRASFMTDGTEAVHHPPCSRARLHSGQRGASVNRRRPGWSRSVGCPAERGTRFRGRTRRESA